MRNDPRFIQLQKALHTPTIKGAMDIAYELSQEVFDNDVFEDLPDYLRASTADYLLSLTNDGEAVDFQRALALAIRDAAWEISNDIDPDKVP